MLKTQILLHLNAALGLSRLSNDRFLTLLIEMARDEARRQVYRPKRPANSKQRRSRELMAA